MSDSTENPDELIRDQCKVEWTDLEEGISGDYDPSDPDDVALLRFDIYGLVEDEWLPVVDASYCTRVPAGTDPRERHRLLGLLADAVAGRVSAAALAAEGIDELEVSGSRRHFEELSWIEPGWKTTPAG